MDLPAIDHKEWEALITHVVESIRKFGESSTDE
jgi:hypothetical protein